MVSLCYSKVNIDDWLITVLLILHRRERNKMWFMYVWAFWTKVIKRTLTPNNSKYKKPEIEADREHLSSVRYTITNFINTTSPLPPPNTNELRYISLMIVLTIVFMNVYNVFGILKKQKLKEHWRNNLAITSDNVTTKFNRWEPSSYYFPNTQCFREFFRYTCYNNFTIFVTSLQRVLYKMIKNLPSPQADQIQKSKPNAESQNTNK